MRNELNLADWRRQTAEMYAVVRERSERDPRGARAEWVSRRDEMFRRHSASPLSEQERSHFTGLDYYPYDPAWRFVVEPIAPAQEGETIRVTLEEGVLRYRPFATVELALPVGTGTMRLTLYWLDGYGGGLFLPFGDTTNGRSTYGGGRYLYDTIKGADLGASPSSVVLDFNFAYNPSCAYSPKWICPLPLRENILAAAVEAGERLSTVKPDTGRMESR